MNQDQFGVREAKRVSNWCQSVKRESKECQMCVTMIDTKNGRKMKQDQICVRESNRVSNWCQRVKKSVKCVSLGLTPKMVEK